MTTTLQEKEIFKYVRAIRNSAKKVYADYYLAWRLGGSNGDSPEPPSFGLSYMGAQAVRMNIDKILNV